MKPYFLPLKKEYYLKLKNGIQTSEIRPAEHRGWNLKNIYPGRVLNCSCGYGKQDRTLKMINRVTVTTDLAMEGVSAEHIQAVEGIYGRNNIWMVAHV